MLLANPPWMVPCPSAALCARPAHLYAKLAFGETLERGLRYLQKLRGFAEKLDRKVDLAGN